MNNQYMQTISLELEDGRTVIYTGRYQIDVTKDKMPKIIDIHLSCPLELPKDAQFKDITSPIAANTIDDNKAKI